MLDWVTKWDFPLLIVGILCQNAVIYVGTLTPLERGSRGRVCANEDNCLVLSSS